MGKVLAELFNEGTTCPSQWSGTTTDGKEFYARYRHGWLTVDINDEEVFELQHGGEYDGGMDTDEMLQLTGYTMKTE